MKRDLITHGATLALGLLVGWLLWGRGPTSAELDRVTRRADRAELLAAANGLRAQALEQRWSDREPQIRAWMDSARQLRQQARGHTGEADAQRRAGEFAQANGDLLGALQAARTQANAIGLAYQACDDATRLDSLALAGCRQSGAEKDSALALHGQTIDSLLAATHQLRRTVARLRPHPWAASAVWEAGRLAPVGAALDRDVSFLRLRLEVTNGPDEPTTLRLGAGLRF